jgi:hypothetical protein
MGAVRLQLARVQEDWQHRIFAAVGITAELECSEGPCPQCGGPTEVQKSWEHRVVTLEHGDFMAHETVHVCKARCRQASGELVTSRSEALVLKVSPGKVYGYDVEVYVGIERFLHHGQREEIRGELGQRYGISLSSGQVSNLAAHFLEHLEALHTSRAPELRAAMDRDGGYPLHLDATGEDGRGTMLVAFSGWRRWVLGAWKIPTERAEFILAALQSIASSFGTPRAIMRDLGRAMREATEEFVQSSASPIRVLACHAHFLSDIGEDLLEEGHDQLRDLFRKAGLLPQLRAFSRQQGRTLGSGIDQGRKGLRLWLESDQNRRIPEGAAGIAAVRSLAQWILDYRTDGSDQGFPFDLPYRDLYDRCLGVSWATEAFLGEPLEDGKVRKALEKLHGILRPVRCDIPRFHPVGAALDRRAKLFTELRRALRLEEEKDQAPGTTCEVEAAKLNDVQSAIEKLTTSLRKRRPERGPAKDLRTAIDLILSHLDRHGPHLWGHVIPIPPECGGGIRLVDRTNNILESWFGSLKHGERRRSGRKVLTQDFERLPPSAALAVNLGCPDYVEILCGSLADLPSAFARLDAENRHKPAVAKRTGADPETASLSTKDRQIVRIPALEQLITAAALSG